jgi:UPF0755 protein
MARSQSAVLKNIWARKPADLPIKTPEELVVLASIVEKETGRADERPRVAGVFINRLNQKMKLQSDPTIVYGLVGGKGTLGRPIQRSEITKATPYNTYVIAGLPPGPIANPGRAAMEAVVNHSRTKELYFVADGTGGHVFAETLDQHNRNVSRWRQIDDAHAAERQAAGRCHRQGRAARGPRQPHRSTGDDPAGGRYGLAGRGSGTDRPARRRGGHPCPCLRRFGRNRARPAAEQDLRSQLAQAGAAAQALSERHRAMSSPSSALPCLRWQGRATTVPPHRSR